MKKEVDDINALYNAWHYHHRTQAPELEALENQCETLILKIKDNNAATYLGTMQTTEEVNRVSSKIMLSKAVNVEKTLNVLDINEGKDSTKSINNQILQKLIDILTYDSLPTIAEEEEHESKKRDGQLYECLYQIARLDAKKGYPKRTLTLKEKDVESILVAVEAVFPKAINYIDYGKLQYLWEKATTRTDKLGRDIFVSKRDEDSEMQNGYPYVRDRMKTSVVSSDDLKEIFTANNKDTTGVLSKTEVRDILTLNAKIKEFGALEPSPRFMEQKEITAINELSKSAENILKWQGKGGGKMSMSGGSFLKKQTKRFLEHISSERFNKCLCKKKVKGFPSGRGMNSWKDIARMKGEDGPRAKAIEAFKKHRGDMGSGCEEWRKVIQKDQKMKSDREAKNAAAVASEEKYKKQGAQLDLDWYRKNSKVIRPAMSILKHILRDDFIAEYNKQYLIAQLTKTGPPERSGNGWTNEYYEPKPAVFKIKEFPDLFNKEAQKKKNLKKYEAQSISTLERNHIFYFTNIEGDIPSDDKVEKGWERGGSQTSTRADVTGGYKKKKTTRRKSRRKTRRKSKKKKEKRKRNTRKR